MKRTLISAAMVLSLITAPAQAQSSNEDIPSEDFDAIGSLLGDMFGQAEPLTDEQKARLPAAMEVVSKLMPDGTMARMMNESMAPMMESMMSGFGASPAIALAELTGLSPLDLTEVADEQLQEALTLLDPQANARNTEMTNAFLDMIGEVVLEVEPAYRAGLARAYTTRFTTDELIELTAFFSTKTGGKYAAESYLIFADPQVMASMNEMVPAVMQRMPMIMETMTEVSSKYPNGRTFSDLGTKEQAKLAELLGIETTELELSEPTRPDGEVEDAYSGT